MVYAKRPVFLEEAVHQSILRYILPETCKLPLSLSILYAKEARSARGEIVDQEHELKSVRLVPSPLAEFFQKVLPFFLIDSRRSYDLLVMDHAFICTSENIDSSTIAQLDEYALLEEHIVSLRSFRI